MFRHKLGSHGGRSILPRTWVLPGVYTMSKQRRFQLEGSLEPQCAKKKLFPEALYQLYSKVTASLLLALYLAFQKKDLWDKSFYKSILKLLACLTQPACCTDRVTEVFRGERCTFSLVFSLGRYNL